MIDCKHILTLLTLMAFQGLNGQQANYYFGSLDSINPNALLKTISND
jgi:hypothetical protein